MHYSLSHGVNIFDASVSPEGAFISHLDINTHVDIMVLARYISQDRMKALFNLQICYCTFIFTANEQKSAFTDCFFFLFFFYSLAVTQAVTDNRFQHQFFKH